MAVSLRLAPLVLLLTLATSAWAQPRPEPAADGRLRIRDAMVAELERSIKRLKLPSYESPYFVSYIVRDYDSVDMNGRLGALYADTRTRARQAYVEVRVGDYKFDNTADDAAAGDWNQASEELYQPGTEIPLDDDPDALRGTLWLLTDARYKAALAALNQKRGARATKVVEDESLPSFARAKGAQGVDAAGRLELDRASWGRTLRAASAVMKKHPEIFDSEIRLQVTHETRYIVTSEGTRLVNERTIWGLHIQGVTRAADGQVLDHGRSYYGSSEAELPDAARLLHEVERVATELGQLRKAPVLDPYTGPAILMEEATGVLFHEVIGHRLEGERLSDEAEGQTFKGQIGQRILPGFLDLVDDPTQQKAGAVSLNGWYRFDDEGVPAEKTTLVDKGILKSYLTSRRPVTGGLRSNGHGRAEGTNDPMARMGNLIVRSSQTASLPELKKRLLDEVRKQGKPFGLILRDITGGSTNTTSYGYQAFKGTPRLVYRVDAKTGDEQLVRGVELVGTPLASINKIILTSDTQGVFNGYCGAESGYVPVSTVAPAVLLTEIELQRSQRTRQRPIVLPPPWTVDKKR